MTRSPGCTCTPTRRAWLDDGTCANCRHRVLESQIQDVVHLELCSDPAVLLYRNNVGLNTHLPSGERRAAPIKYGVGNPGGADLLGLCHGGRFLAVETKTVRGRQSPEQRAFERFVTARAGIYAVCRSAADARALLASLRGLA